MGDGELGSVLQPRQPSSEELDLEVELTGTQAGFHFFLKTKDQEREKEAGDSSNINKKLASMYIGGLYAIRHKKNPYKFSLAAHALRELIEKLLRLSKGNPAGVPSPKELQEAYEKYEKAKGDSNEKEYLDYFLGKAKKFFTKSTIITTSNREKARKMFQENELTRGVIPEPLLHHKVKEIMIYHNFFQGVSHGKSTGEREFNGYVKGLEDCLLGMFNLRYGDEINKLIEEAETGDKSD